MEAMKAGCVPLGTFPRELRISSICPQPQNIGPNDKCQLNFLILLFDLLVVENYPFSQIFRPRFSPVSV